MRFDHPAPEHLAGLQDLWIQAFGDTREFVNSFFTTAFSPQRCLCVPDGDNVRAALYWFDCNLADRKIAYLYAVATEEKARDRDFAKR